MTPADDHVDAASRAVATIAADLIGDRGREHLIVTALDSLGLAIRREVVATGTRREVLARPSEIFKAVPSSAAGFLLVHNHPDGSAPSDNDRREAARIGKLGEERGIPLLGCFVVSWTATGELVVRSVLERRPRGSADPGVQIR